MADGSKSTVSPVEGRSSKFICLSNRRSPRIHRSPFLKSHRKLPRRERLPKNRIYFQRAILSPAHGFPIDKTVFICQNFCRICDLNNREIHAPQIHRRTFSGGSFLNSLRPPKNER